MADGMSDDEDVGGVDDASAPASASASEEEVAVVSSTPSASASAVRRAKEGDADEAAAGDRTNHLISFLARLTPENTAWLLLT